MSWNDSSAQNTALPSNGAGKLHLHLTRLYHQRFGGNAVLLLYWEVTFPDIYLDLLYCIFCRRTRTAPGSLSQLFAALNFRPNKLNKSSKAHEPAMHGVCGA